MFILWPCQAVYIFLNSHFLWHTFLAHSYSNFKKKTEKKKRFCTEPNFQAVIFFFNIALPPSLFSCFCLLQIYLLGLETINSLYFQNCSKRTKEAASWSDTFSKFLFAVQMLSVCFVLAGYSGCLICSLVRLTLFFTAPAFLCYSVSFLPSSLLNIKVHVCLINT